METANISTGFDLPATAKTGLELNTGFLAPHFNEVRRTPDSASDWFCLMFPRQVRVYGCPFLEQRQMNRYGGSNTTPLVPNIDCLAACLGGDKRLGHQVIYYAAELEFYFYDPRSEMFHATSSEKLGSLLRALLARCASEVKGDAHLLSIFHTFRSDQMIKTVVNRAKSILCASVDFFSATSIHQRVYGPEIHERLARVFCEQILEREPGHILTIGQAYKIFTDFAQQKNLPPLKRTLFKGLLSDVVREQYGLGVRNDLINTESETQQCGWKGLRANTTIMATA